MDLNFENGFLLQYYYDREDHEKERIAKMWKNFQNYYTKKYKFIDLPIMEAILLREFNATVQRFADKDHDDDQYFVRFKTQEDYTYFLLRFS